MHDLDDSSVMNSIIHMMKYIKQPNDKMICKPCKIKEEEEEEEEEEREREREKRTCKKTNPFCS